METEDAGFALRDLTALSDIVFAASDKAQVRLSDQNYVEGSDQLDPGWCLTHSITKLGPAESLIKRGRRERLIPRRQRDTRTERHACDTERDPVGVGDAFAAGNLHGVTISSSPQERPDFAGEVVAHTVIVSGDSQGLRKGNLLQVSGQGPMDPVTNSYIAEGDVYAQTTRTLENVRAILEAGGASVEDVLMFRVYLTEQSLFPAMNEAYGEFVKQYVPSGNWPCRTTVFTGQPHPEMLVEIDALASL